VKRRRRPSGPRRPQRPRLKPLTWDFEDRLRDAWTAAAKELWVYYFPFLFCYGRAPGREIFYSHLGGSHVLFLERETARGRQLDLVVPPMPLTREALGEAYGVIAMRRRPRPGRILWVDETDRQTLQSWGQEVVEKELEYLIDPRVVTDPDAHLPRRLRRKLAEADETAPRLVPYDARFTEQAWELLDRLAETGDPELPLLDYDYTGQCLDWAPKLIERGMVGLATLRGDELTGFAFGGAMTDAMANFFILKTDPDVPGLAEWLRIRFLERMTEFRLVNDASDLGREGLAQHKRQFMPVRMLPAFTVRALTALGGD
jgi:hypothetical protein